MKERITLATSFGEASPVPARLRLAVTPPAGGDRALRNTGDHPWRLRPSHSYLQALGDADRIVVRTLVRRIGLRRTRQSQPVGAASSSGLGNGPANA